MSAGTQAPVAPKKQSTKVELEKRRAATRELIALQTSRPEIVRVLMGQPFHCSKAVAYREIDRAYRDMEEDAKKSGSIARVRLVTISALQNLYQRCVQAKRYGEAIRAQAELCKLQGLYPAAPVQVEVSGGLEVTDSQTTAQLRGELAALMAQREAMLAGAAGGHNGSGEPH